jgi:hypothetical protein
MGRQHQQGGTVGEIDINRKRSSYIEKACFRKSQNYCSIGDSTVEQDVHLEDTVSIKNI